MNINNILGWVYIVLTGMFLFFHFMGRTFEQDMQVMLAGIGCFATSIGFFNTARIKKLKEDKNGNNKTRWCKVRSKPS